MSNPFGDIIKSINRKTGPLSVDFINEHYNPWAMNKVFARTPDGLVVAEQLNRMGELTKYEHYMVYYTQLSKNPRRFGEKVDAVEKPRYLEMVMEYHGFSKPKAYAALSILLDQELYDIEKYLDKGGVKKDEHTGRHI